jgi:hypothetical protein
LATRVNHPYDGVGRIEEEEVGVQKEVDHDDE